MKKFNLDDLTPAVRRQKRSVKGSAYIAISKSCIYMSPEFVKMNNYHLYKYLVFFGISKNEVIILGYMNIDEVPHQLRQCIVQPAKIGKKETDNLSRQVTLKDLQNQYLGYKFFEFEPVDVSGRSGVLCKGTLQDKNNPEQNDKAS
jgi:hypothetical protein